MVEKGNRRENMYKRYIFEFFIFSDAKTNKKVSIWFLFQIFSLRIKMLYMIKEIYKEYIKGVFEKVRFMIFCLINIVVLCKKNARLKALLAKLNSQLVFYKIVISVWMSRHNSETLP